MSDRRGLFKNADRDVDRMRRVRNDNSVEIRKVKKEDNLQKRRNIQLEDLSDSSPIKNSSKPVIVLTTKEICKKMKSSVMDEKLDAVIACRKQLSKANNPPIEQYFMNGAIKTLVDIMRTAADDTLLFESAWALTNIASGESRHTNAVVDAGAVPVFMNLLGHTTDIIVEQSMWALANIVGDSDKCRNLVVKLGIVQLIIDSVRRFWNNITIIRQLGWLISNIFRHKSDNYPVDSIVSLLPTIHELMSKNMDSTLQADLTWALSYGTDSNSSIVDGVIAYNFLQIAIANLKNENNIVAPSIRLLGNVVAGTEDQTNAAIQSGVIFAIAPLLDVSGSSKIVKECCWLLSNICAGTEDQVMAIVNSGIVDSVLNVMSLGDYKSQKESIWVISNMISCQKDEPKLYLLNHSVFTHIIRMLTCDDNKVVMQLLESIRALFQVVENYGELEQCISVFEDAGGIEVLEELQNHQSEDVYTMSHDLIQDFFDGDEEDENEAENLQKFEF